MFLYLPYLYVYGIFACLHVYLPVYLQAYLHAVFASLRYISMYIFTIFILNILLKLLLGRKCLSNKYREYFLTFDRAFGLYVELSHLYF